MKFLQKLFENWRFWKFRVGHFEISFFFQKKIFLFCFIPMKISQSFLVSKILIKLNMTTLFDPHQTLCTRVYFRKILGFWATNPSKIYKNFIEISVYLSKIYKNFIEIQARNFILSHTKSKSPPLHSVNVGTYNWGLWGAVQRSVCFKQTSVHSFSNLFL